MKQIILCADDYGQNTAISTGIRQLVAKRRLSAVSCMVTTPNWEASGTALKPYIDHIDIGLHFNLTEGAEFPKHNTLMRRALCRQIKQIEIENVLTTQLERFEKVMGFAPQFIDGHQHVHQLPVIRDALINIYQKHYQANKPYIRLAKMDSIRTAIKQPSFIKRLIIHMTGANALKQLLDKHNIPYNTQFAGVHNFKSKHYAKIFAQFLPEANQSTLIMCHPGEMSSDHFDAIRQSRSKEFDFFNSDEFLQILEREQIQLCRFQELQ